LRGKPTIFYGTLLLSGVNLLLQGVSMLFQIYLSRSIGAAGLGLLQLILSVAAMALTVGISGIRITAMYLCAEEIGLRRLQGLRRVLSGCMRYGLVMSIAAGLALIFGANALSEHWIGDLRAAMSLRILGTFLPINCLCSIMTGYFTASGRLQQLVWVEIGERAVYIGLTVFLLQFWAGQDLERACCAIVLGSCASGVLSLLAMGILCLRALPEPEEGEEKIPVLRRMLKLCVPLAIGDYVRSGLSTTEQMLIPKGLERHGGSVDASMAAYGTIHGMVFPVIMFPTAFLAALIDLLIPELSQSKIRGREERIRALTDHCFRLGALFACSCAGILHLFAETLGTSLYRSDQAGYYIAVFAPLVAVLYLDSITDGILKGLGQQVHTVRYNTLTSALDVLGLLILLPRFGIAGYYISFTVTHFLNFILSMARLLTVSGFRLPAGFCVKLLLCFGISIVITRPLPWSFLPLFFCLLSLCRAFRREDIRWFYGVLRRKKVDAPAQSL